MGSYPSEYIRGGLPGGLSLRVTEYSPSQSPVHAAAPFSSVFAFWVCPVEVDLKVTSSPEMGVMSL